MPKISRRFACPGHKEKRPAAVRRDVRVCQSRADGRSRAPCLFLITDPVRDRDKLCPMLINVALVGVLMAVGGLLDSQVILCTGLIVGPDNHAVKQVLFRFRNALEHAVDHRHRLGAGDRLIGTERTVLIAENPAEGRGAPDFLLGPVAPDV